MKGLRMLRLYAFLEGLSLLLLVGIAMPLKYLLALPMAVRVAGSVHGLLFLLFVSALVRVTGERRWAPRRYLTVFGASLVPGGTFFMDRSLKRESEGIVDER